MGGRTQEALYSEIDLELSWSEAELPQAARTKHVHGLHPYLGKYVPQLVEIFLTRFFRPGQCVYDPFVGSGTTLVEANVFGADGVGCDISAFNCLLSRVKTTPYSLGTLGGGNHFIELCLDEEDMVWVMLHSGSRNIGNRMGTYFIERAKNALKNTKLVDKELAWLSEGTEDFDDYVRGVGWAQDYARLNRELMMASVMDVLRTSWPDLKCDELAVNCHHNYVQREEHYGEKVWLTRKGAVRAGLGDMGIIPGSMGTRSYIVRGKGNAESFHSCSHGAGRKFSRTEAKRRITLEQHAKAMKGIEARLDGGVLDESPAAYKDIDAVMAAQSDLVEVVHTLRQVVCVKG